jgi:hypothetical protein
MSERVKTSFVTAKSSSRCVLAVAVRRPLDPDLVAIYKTLHDARRRLAAQLAIS